MLGYVTVGSNDLPKANAFYADLLGDIGMTKLFDHPSGGTVFAKDGKIQFGVLGPFNGEPATVGNGSMVAMQLDNPAAVDAFHAKVLALGGSCEGAPGDRGGFFYAAYMRDLDGNKLCAYTMPAAA